jgi:hypothetical protein
LRSAAACEEGQFLFRQTHALWQDDAQTIDECGLGGVRLGDAAQVKVAVCCGWQDDVVGPDACKLFEDGALRVSETGAALLHLQALPQHEGATSLCGLIWQSTSD